MEEENFNLTGSANRVTYQSKLRSESKLVALVIKLSGGLIKTERQANALLIILVIVFTFSSWFILSKDEVRDDLDPRTGQVIYPGIDPTQK